MTFFFLVVGLEARREFDLGELRDRRRLALPVVAGLGGMVVPIADLPGDQRRATPSSKGWGTAMSTDTAFALGMLALVGRRFPDSLRTFILTVAVVDDLVALVVIVVVYTTGLRSSALIVGLSDVRAGGSRARANRVRNGAVYVALGADRVGGAPEVRASTRSIVGLVMGLLTIAYPACRVRPRAGDRPVPAVPRAADVGATRRSAARRACGSAISPNERSSSSTTRSRAT